MPPAGALVFDSDCGTGKTPFLHAVATNVKGTAVALSLPLALFCDERYMAVYTRRKSAVQRCGKRVLPISRFAI